MDYQAVEFYPFYTLRLYDVLTSVQFEYKSVIDDLAFIVATVFCGDGRCGFFAGGECYKFLTGCR